MICRVCDSKNLELAIDLGDQPWGNHFLTKDEVGKEPFYPLKVVFCHDCGTSQLDYTVKKEVMFADHTYLSGMTKSLDDHFKTTAKILDEAFFKDKTEKSVLDIGSNDGTQLKHYQNMGYEALGVESSVTIAKMANEAGVETLNKFFNLETVKEVGKKFDVINASGVFFHLEELHSVTEGIREGLNENGVFCVQFLYMQRIFENLAFDQIYHEHLLYYNLNTIEKLLQRHGLAMFDCYLSPIHGGSIVAYVTHAGKKEPSKRLLEMRRVEEEKKSNEFSTYLDFAKSIEKMKTENLEYLDKAKAQGKTIYGFGAPVKGNTMLNYFNVGTDYLDYLVEKNPMRKGLYSPGKHIPIILEDELKEFPDIYYVLAWNFKKEILAKNQALINDGVEFYFPVNPKD
jgi:SAM-dependent methyltransferase